MIRVRDDDVLLRSRGWPEPNKRFIAVHEKILKGNGKFIHVPTILCKTIQEWPHIIEYIKDETTAKRMMPELHGWEHIDYINQLSLEEAKGNLLRCKDWMHENLGIVPKRWYTPWGGCNPQFIEMAASIDLELISCVNVYPPGRVLNEGLLTYDVLAQKEIFVHWWQGMGKLEDIIGYVMREYK